MSLVKKLDFSDGSDNPVVLRVCHSCHGDTDHGAVLSICGSISAPSDTGKWVV